MTDYRENNKWTVYIHTSPSGKYYVGITSRKPSERWRNGHGYRYKYKTHFYSAILKYGWDAFGHEVIAERLTKEEAEKMEVSLIFLLGSNNAEYGYNKESGGNVGKSLSEETINIIRKKTSGENNHNFGKKFSKEHCKKISLSHVGDKNPMYGKTGSKHHGSIKVICVSTNKIFDSLIEASNFYNIHFSAIQFCLNGNSSYAGFVDGINLQWARYDEYLEGKAIIQEIKRPKHLVVCLETNKIYKSTKQILEDENNIKCSYSGIRGCCIGKYKHCGSMKDGTKLSWMYYDDYIKINN